MPNLSIPAALPYNQKDSFASSASKDCRPWPEQRRGQWGSWSFLCIFSARSMHVLAALASCAGAGGGG